MNYQFRCREKCEGKTLVLAESGEDLNCPRCGQTLIGEEIPNTDNKEYILTERVEQELKESLDNLL